RLGDQLPQQFRLADPRLSAHDQDGTAAPSHVRDELSQDLKLGGPAEQPGRRTHVIPTIRSEDQGRRFASTLLTTSAWPQRATRRWDNQTAGLVAGGLAAVDVQNLPGDVGRRLQEQ